MTNSNQSMTSSSCTPSGIKMPAFFTELGSPLIKGCHSGKGFPSYNNVQNNYDTFLFPHLIDCKQCACNRVFHAFPALECIFDNSISRSHHIRLPIRIPSFQGAIFFAKNEIQIA